MSGPFLVLGAFAILGAFWLWTLKRRKPQIRVPEAALPRSPSVRESHSRVPAGHRVRPLSSTPALQEPSSFREDVISSIDHDNPTSLLGAILIDSLTPDREPTRHEHVTHDPTPSHDTTHQHHDPSPSYDHSHSTYEAPAHDSSPSSDSGGGYDGGGGSDTGSN